MECVDRHSVVSLWRLLSHLMVFARMSQSMTGGGVVGGGGVGDYARAPSAEFSLTLSHFMASFMSHNSASLAGEEGGGATVLVCFFFFFSGQTD